MTTMLIASCNNDIRESVKAVLDLKRDLYPITCSCKFDEIIEKSEILSPQFIIVDLLKEFKMGCELILKIKKNLPELKIIAITASNDVNTMIDVFRSGVDGYLVNSALFNELYRCVCTLLMGDKYVSIVIVNEVLNSFINTPEKDLQKLPSRLSSKESVLLTYIAEGLNPKEIAHIMNISKKTVDNYRNKIMKKLNLYSIADIVKYALREQLIEL